jgi:hypothetical protein
MTTREKAIDDACTVMFSTYPEIAKEAASSGSPDAFRFLADQVVSLIGDDADLELIYRSLHARVCLAKAGLGLNDPQRATYLQVVATAFDLGMRCGKSVHSTQRMLRQQEREAENRQCQSEVTVSVPKNYVPNDSYASDQTPVEPKPDEHIDRG